MASIENWKTRGEFKQLMGREMFVVDTGEHDKPIILLIHGFPTSSWDWLPIWDHLAAKNRLIAMDMLGFGFSDKPDPHPYSIHEQADLIEALVRDLDLSKFHVLAHDYGDTVAQELLARQNESKGAGNWQSLCLLNGGLFPETHQALLIQKLLLSPLGPLINRLTTRQRFDSSMRRVWGTTAPLRDHELDGFWQLVNFKNGRHIFHNLITYMRDRKTHRTRWVAALKDADIPIGLINGSADPVSGAHMIAHYKNIVGAPDFLVELPTTGHYPQVEDSISVAENYLDFLRAITQSK